MCKLTQAPSCCFSLACYFGFATSLPIFVLAKHSRQLHQPPVRYTMLLPSAVILTRACIEDGGMMRV